jgi:D-apiose dehydrogenase
MSGVQEIHEPFTARSDDRHLRVGLLGCGWVSEHHLRAWSSISDRAEIVALVDPSNDALKRRGDEFGVERRYSSAEAMLEAGEIDALDVATPRETHAAAVRLGASRGLPVLCQKPLAPTLSEAKSLVQEVGTRTRLMVHENWRFRPYIRDMKQFIDAGLIGPVKQCSFTLCNSGFIAGPDRLPPAVSRQPFFADVDRMLVTEILIHHIDSLRFIFGSLTLAAAHVGHSVPQVRGDDFATIMLRGSGELSPSIVILANLAAQGYQARVSDHFVVFGNDGTMTLKDNVLTVDSKSGKSEKVYDPDVVYNASYAAAIGHFVSSLRNGTAFETSPEDNLKTLQLVESVYQAGGM